jgi:hypothetical protein
MALWTVCRRRLLEAQKATFNEKLGKTMNLARRNKLLYQIKYVRLHRPTSRRVEELTCP